MYSDPEMTVEIEQRQLCHDIISIVILRGCANDELRGFIELVRANDLDHQEALQQYPHSNSEATKANLDLAVTRLTTMWSHIKTSGSAKQEEQSLAKLLDKLVVSVQKDAISSQSVPSRLASG